MNTRDKGGGNPRDVPAYDPPLYELPSIRVYTEDELLAQLGPAQLYVGGAMPWGF